MAVWGSRSTNRHPGASLASAEPDEPDAEAPAFILQTSGTTAKPKLIPTSHRNMLASAARVQGWFDLTTQDRCLCVSPVFYAHGLHVMIFTPLLTGGSIVFPSDPSRFDFAEWFDALEPTWYSAGPTLHRLVFDNTGSANDGKHSLRFVLSGGAPLTADLIEGLQKKLGVPVVEHYGSSEGMQICSNQLRPGTSRPGTCGIPSPNTIRIVADDGSPVAAGQRGEILIGGPTVVSGYLNAPELTATSFVDGWFKSGDIGSIDEDGFLTLHGRKDDLINRGGEKISPAEIDEVLMRHPAVAEAAAYAVPHPRLGQDVAAAVVLRPGASASSAELRRFLQGQLAAFKIPGQISIRDQLPKGKTGKVLRRQVGAEAEDDTPAPAAAVTPTSDDPALNTLIVQLKELWERLLKINSLSLDDDFSEMGGNSLLAMEMLSEVERLTGQTIPSSVLFEARTIRQLAHALSEQHIEPKPVTRMNADGSLPPVLLFHGDYNGGGLYAARLAAKFGPGAAALSSSLRMTSAKSPTRSRSRRLLPTACPWFEGSARRGPIVWPAIAWEDWLRLRSLASRCRRRKSRDRRHDRFADGQRAPFGEAALSVLRQMRPIAGEFTKRAMRRSYFICSQIDRPLKSVKSWAADVFRWRHDEREANLLAVLDDGADPVAIPVVYFSAAYGSAAWRRVCSEIETIDLEGDQPKWSAIPTTLQGLLHTCGRGSRPASDLLIWSLS